MKSQSHKGPIRSQRERRRLSSVQQMGRRPLTANRVEPIVRRRLSNVPRSPKQGKSKNRNN
jgi:hypothetical protein